MTVWAAAAAAVIGVVAAGATAAPQPGVDRGAAVAQRRCAACHAVGLEARSPNLAAPPFRGLASRYSSLALEQALTRVSKQGHFEMRPRDLPASEAGDLAAYIESLAPPPK